MSPTSDSQLSGQGQVHPGRAPRLEGPVQETLELAVSACSPPASQQGEGRARPGLGLRKAARRGPLPVHLVEKSE